MAATTRSGPLASTTRKERLDGQFSTLAFRRRGPPERVGAPLSPADLQAILAHLNNDRDELLAGTGADQPVVAIRVPASVGRPG